MNLHSALSGNNHLAQALIGRPSARGVASAVPLHTENADPPADVCHSRPFGCIRKSTMGIYERDYMRTGRQSMSQALSRSAGAIALQRLTRPSSRDDAGQAWFGMLIPVLAGQILAFLIPTLSVGLTGAWRASWLDASPGAVRWDELSTWLLTVPGTAVITMLALKLPATRLRGLTLALLGALQLAVLSRQPNWFIFSGVALEEFGWPAGDAAAVVAFSLGFAVLTIGVAPCSRVVRWLAMIAGIASVPLFVLQPDFLGFTYSLSDFVEPIRRTWNAQVVELGTHSEWHLGSVFPRSRGIPLPSDWVQTLAKWLQLIGVLVGLGGAAVALSTAIVGLRRNENTDSVERALWTTLLGPVLVVVAGFLWMWAVPGTHTSACLAETFNHAMALLQALSLIAYSPLVIAAFVCSMSRCQS